MGVFDESICDCCVCPMQCVMKQLVGVGLIGIDTPISRVTTIITSVEDFIVSTSDEGDIPICQITHVDIGDPTNTNITQVLSALKSIKNNKGECACCEDPMTNLLSSEIGNTFDVEFISTFTSPLPNEIIGVGEGILIGLEGAAGASLFLNTFSTCSITRVIPLTTEQINDPDRPSRRTISPLAT
ncbi:hypothetical protein [Chengkuizengella axinellae]|uniref:Spore coat protein n=1 Tax=Chengkuizengella axinellae TaxID=3064388 RepID=A0ABT9ITM6_9BACL|nr:hypothetical protein [Chengkuizengella sp. 2205SS18-9]MDP5272667.1 hypothetical protein [Chengkuizengella sp. 2205SS18-9]